MSSVHHDTKNSPAGDVSDETRTTNSSRDFDQQVISAAKLQIPTANVEECEKHPTANGTPESPTANYPGPLALLLLMTAICAAVFLVSLDRTIITTAIPHITDQFHSYNNVGWYASAYLITACSFLPTYGRIYGMLHVKWTFLSGLFIFELGSLICGLAPNSKVLIAGRAIAGTGSAGILTGAYVVVAHSIPMQKRPLYAGIVGMIFGLGAIVGPILGGSFTDRVTWRWCFYFNLPLGGFIAAAAALFLRPQSANTFSRRPLIQLIIELDPVGNVILLGTAAMFFQAMQYSAEPHAWHTPRVIGLLAGAAATFAIFIISQWRNGEQALIPPSIILQRNTFAGCTHSFFLYATLTLQVYYLPIWFQACRAKTALDSGVATIPYLLGNSLLAILTGAFVSKIGYFAPPAILGSAIATAGSGLLASLAVDTDSARWIGYEVLASVGLGMALQQGYVAAQSVLNAEQITVGSALVSAFQSLGGAISISVGNTVLLNELYAAALPGVNIEAVVAAGATGFRHSVPRERIPALLDVYNEALRKVLLIGVVCSGLAFLTALGLEWRSVRTEKADSEALEIGSAKPT